MGLNIIKKNLRTILNVQFTGLILLMAIRAINHYLQSPITTQTTFIVLQPSALSALTVEEANFALRVLIP
jgi:hypothetical protein